MCLALCWLVGFSMCVHAAGAEKKKKLSSYTLYIHIQRDITQWHMYTVDTRTICVQSSDDGSPKYG